jgi:hypothetical protein
MAGRRRRVGGGRGGEGHQWWLTPVILATQTEIRRIMVQSQPGQIVCESLSQKKKKKKTLNKKELVEWLQV